MSPSALTPHPVLHTQQAERAEAAQPVLCHSEKDANTGRIDTELEGAEVPIPSELLFC